jgi:hypothetical protein
MRKEHLADEVMRRDIMRKVIHKLVWDNYEKAPKARAPRDKIYFLVAKALKVKRSNALCRMVKEVLVSENIRPYIFHGTLYFKGMREITNA